MVIWNALTSFELLYLVITLCGFVAVVVSLVSIKKQTKLLAQSARCDTYASITNNLTATKQIFIEHPNLRPYFYHNLSISKTDDRYSQAEAVAEHLLDFFDGVLLQEEAQLWPPHLWENYIKDHFRRSPILCERLAETAHWYTDTLTDLKTEACPNSRLITEE